MLLTYGLQYLDKAVLGFAAVYTLDKDNVRFRFLVIYLLA